MDSPLVVGLLLLAFARRLRPVCQHRSRAMRLHAAQRADAHRRADGRRASAGGGRASCWRKGRGERLLISGVNRQTSRDDLKRKQRPARPAVRVLRRHRLCGARRPAATPTRPRHGPRTGGFKRLIIVTSSYHMPRSLTELRRTLPEIALVPYPVVSSKLPHRALVDARRHGPGAVLRVREVPALGRPLRRCAPCCAGKAARSPARQSHASGR